MCLLSFKSHRKHIERDEVDKLGNFNSNHNDFETLNLTYYINIGFILHALKQNNFNIL